MKRRKTNENRIPISKDSFDTDAILKASTDGMVFRTWALLFTALSTFSDITAQDIMGLWLATSNYDSNIHDFHAAERMLDLIHSLTGVRFPLVYVRSSEIRTQGELNRFIKRANSNAVSTAIAVIFEPIIEKNLMDQERLQAVVRKIVDLREEISEERITFQDTLDMLRDEYGLILEQDISGASLRRAE